MGSLTTRQVLGLQMVSRDWNALAMHYLAQARVHRRVTSVTFVTNFAFTRVVGRVVGRVVSCPVSCPVVCGACCQSLELTTVARVVREVVERLLPSIPNLRSLNVGKCYKLTSADVGAILKSCPQLQALHFEVRRHAQHSSACVPRRVAFVPCVSCVVRVVRRACACTDAQVQGCRIADAALRAIIAANPPLRALNVHLLCAFDIYIYFNNLYLLLFICYLFFSIYD
jgi:hypothetical protein